MKFWQESSTPWHSNRCRQRTKLRAWNHFKNLCVFPEDGCVVLSKSGVKPRSNVCAKKNCSQTDCILCEKGDYSLESQPVNSHNYFTYLLYMLVNTNTVESYLRYVYYIRILAEV